MLRVAVIFVLDDVTAIPAKRPDVVAIDGSRDTVRVDVTLDLQVLVKFAKHDDR